MNSYLLRIKITSSLANIYNRKFGKTFHIILAVQKNLVKSNFMVNYPFESRLSDYLIKCLRYEKSYN